MWTPLEGTGEEMSRLSTVLWIETRAQQPRFGVQLVRLGEDGATAGHPRTGKATVCAGFYAESVRNPRLEIQY